VRGPVERPKRPQCGEGPRRAQALAAALARGPSCPGASHSQKPKPCARARGCTLRCRHHGQAGSEVHTCVHCTEHVLAGVPAPGAAPAATARGRT
jgi:hypothetical protein